MAKSATCVAALSALLLTSCETDTGRSAASADAGRMAAIEAEKSAAMNDYAECVREKAQKLDDGNSDASLIAMAIQPDCKDQFSRYVKISGIGMSSRDFATCSERLEENQTQLTAGIVQKMRQK